MNEVQLDLRCLIPTYMIYVDYIINFFIVFAPMNKELFNFPKVFLLLCVTGVL
jgi:hypothetical protein